MCHRMKRGHASEACKSTWFFNSGILCSFLWLILISETVRRTNIVSWSDTEWEDLCLNVICENSFARYGSRFRTLHFPRIRSTDCKLKRKSVCKFLPQLASPRHLSSSPTILLRIKNAFIDRIIAPAIFFNGFPPIRYREQPPSVRGARLSRLLSECEMKGTSYEFYSVPICMFSTRALISIYNYNECVFCLSAWKAANE